MCQTIHCFGRMQGHGHQIGSLDDLLNLLGQLGGEKKAPRTPEQFVQDQISEMHQSIRASETVLTVLQKEPPEPGAKLVGIAAYKPVDPEAGKVGVVTIVTYALEGGAFQVIATDHLSQEVVSHSCLNIHGLDGLTESVKQELLKKIEASEVEA